MDTLKALLEILPSRLPYVSFIIGLLFLTIGLLPFKIIRSGWEIKSPSTKVSRLITIVLGILLTCLSLYIIIIADDLELSRASKKRLAYYFSYVTLTGTESECRDGKCRILYHDSALVVSPYGKDCSYSGRIKSSGNILYFKSKPMHEILNPEQYPNNPAYLEFRIRPANQSDRKLMVQGEAAIETKLSANKGKIGPHLPYDADHVVFILDFRGLDFKIQKQIEPKIETKRDDSTLLSGYQDPRLSIFEDGNVFVLTASNVLAGSSVYLSWGQ